MVDNYNAAMLGLVPWRETDKISGRIDDGVTEAIRFADWLASYREELRRGVETSLRDLRAEKQLLHGSMPDNPRRLLWAKREARIAMLEKLIAAAERQSETVRVVYSLVHPRAEGEYCRTCHGACEYPDAPENFVECDDCGKQVHVSEAKRVDVHHTACPTCYKKMRDAA